ncbi:hypothetical protein HETIRDRAFT_327583 [Heterobasidion irregulare TC 32-1]|uniref:DUF6697 domain-containing protein n=1 Tax=Heterobasidion irregulare (strain TC 32-1) TaxID=747525 RepID=W4JU62_HETIT|nr:uncharacterized protein HETIRDRAFT_327583 [Heterobasidion irregulare TC 32-1]ETW76999.1 hypothetical protein HETIRDRAFT_327583 [Heterobasidion irregulare TC 32-1]
MAATVEDHTGPSRTNESDQSPLASVSVRNRISIDASYAPEMVKFWAKKYQDAKKELDLLKVRICITFFSSEASCRDSDKAVTVCLKQRHLFTQPDRNELQQEQKSLKTLVSQLKSESRVRAAYEKELNKTVVKAQQQKDKWQEEVVRFEKERTETVGKVADLEAENEALKQSRTSMVNVMLWLRRLIKVGGPRSRQFTPVSFIDPVFLEGIKPVQLPETLLDALGPKVSLMLSGDRPSMQSDIHFIRRPPICMPLCVEECGMHGHWFYPTAQVRENTPVDLVIESTPNMWMYLGKYLCAFMPVSEMQLSEWMNLNEITKVIHCRQVVSAGLPPDQSVLLPAQMTMKRRYETGEWSVPCFSLRCVGFDVDLYNSLHLAVEELMRPTAALEKRPVRSDAENDAVNKRIRITQSPGRPSGNGTDVSPAQSSSLTYDPHPELNPENILASPHSS